MLLLTRKLEQKIRIGKDVVITILKIQGDQITIGIDAPREIPIAREELVINQEIINEIKERNRASIMKQEEILK